MVITNSWHCAHDFSGGFELVVCWYGRGVDRTIDFQSVDEYIVWIGELTQPFQTYNGMTVVCLHSRTR